MGKLLICDCLIYLLSGAQPGRLEFFKIVFREAPGLIQVFHSGVFVLTAIEGDFCLSGLCGCGLKRQFIVNRVDNRQQLSLFNVIALPRPHLDHLSPGPERKPGPVRQAISPYRSPIRIRALARVAPFPFLSGSHLAAGCSPLLPWEQEVSTKRIKTKRTADKNRIAPSALIGFPPLRLSRATFSDAAHWQIMAPRHNCATAVFSSVLNPRRKVARVGSSRIFFISSGMSIIIQRPMVRVHVWSKRSAPLLRIRQPKRCSSKAPALDRLAPTFLSRREKDSIGRFSLNMLLRTDESRTTSGNSPRSFAY